MGGRLSSIKFAFLTQHLNCFNSYDMYGKYAEDVEIKHFEGWRLNGREHLCRDIIAHISTSVEILVTFLWKYVQNLFYFWQY
jgi:hypothetical protein